MNGRRPPRVFTVPPGAPFLPTLADALLAGALVGATPTAAGVHVIEFRPAGDAPPAPGAAPSGAASAGSTLSRRTSGTSSTRQDMRPMSSTRASRATAFMRALSTTPNR